MRFWGRKIPQGARPWLANRAAEFYRVLQNPVVAPVLFVAWVYSGCRPASSFAPMLKCGQLYWIMTGACL